MRTIAANTYNRKMFNAKLILLLYFVLGIYSCFGQSFQRITHTGIETSFGIRGLRLPMKNSSNRLQALSTGYAMGFVTGNNLMKARLRPIAFYKSSPTEKRAFELLESEALLNIYPLEFLRTRKHVLDIYVSTGLNFTSFRYKDRDVFFQNDGKAVDMEYHQLDKVSVISQVTGIGIEYHLPFSFVHIFSEALFSNSMYLSTNNETFKQTWKQAATTLNFGVRFGTKKNVKNNRHYPG